jgi:hypothetical protein
MFFFTTADNLKHFFWDTVYEFGIPVIQVTLVIHCSNPFSVLCSLIQVPLNSPEISVKSIQFDYNLVCDWAMFSQPPLS